MSTKRQEISQINLIHVIKAPRDILIFHTSKEEIETIVEVLKYKTKALETNMGEIIIYGNLLIELHAKGKEGCPATNIIETSLRIVRMKYSYNHRTGIESLPQQGKGQIDLVEQAPINAFRLYIAYNYQHDLDDNIIPKIQRTNLANVVLMLKSLHIHDLLPFEFMDPPPSKTLIKYKCSDEATSIAVMFSVGNSNFHRPKEKQVHTTMRDWIFKLETDEITSLCLIITTHRNRQITECSGQKISLHQLKRLLERIEIEVTLNLANLVTTKKTIAYGLFLHMERLLKMDSEEVRLQDQREMEQLERNICQMDAAARGKLTKESLK
ncbi:hypothetical protein Prudu_021946 [Prunus dulcis]|uniref:RNA helicase n=1 Tax=Prunus dulcis TaxID=3755 RepID=A0A4Y1RYF1_PRUDU|nr:hypothetical protein Prudu_021946 [Prunus dulcis]